MASKKFSPAKFGQNGQRHFWLEAADSAARVFAAGVCPSSNSRLKTYSQDDLPSQNSIMLVLIPVFYEVN
jgi:hypothetical protein